MRYILCLLVFLCTPALAQEFTPEHKEGANFPSLTGDGFASLESDWGINSDDPDSEQGNTYATVEVYPTFWINDKWAVVGNFVFDQMQDPDVGEDSFLDNQGMYVEEIYATYQNENWGGLVGKFDPRFGKAWGSLDGIWTTDFTGDYQLVEKIGAAGSYTFGGAHTLTLSAFFNDTSFLSRSAFTDRGRVREADGGAGNTGSPSSFALSLEGAEIPQVPNLYYTLGARHLAQGDADVGPEYGDENAFVGTLGYVWKVAEDLTLDTMGEVMRATHFNGGGDDVWYATAIAVARWKEKWNLTLAYTDRSTDVYGAGTEHDNLGQITAGYDFDNGIYIAAGWRTAQESGVDTDSLGAVVGYNFDF